MSLDGLSLEQLVPKLSSNNKKFSFIDLSGQKIGDDGAKKLAEALDGNTQVTILYLPANRIGPMGAMALSGAFKNLSQLKELYMGQNRIQNEGAQAIASWLACSSCKVEILDLSSNRITDDEALMESRNEHLDFLTLIGNPIPKRQEKEKPLLRPITEGSMLHYPLCHERTMALINKQKESDTKEK